MKSVRIITKALAALIILCAANACSPTPAKLNFRPDGSFKILQLTDLHLQLFHPDQIADVFARMDSLVRRTDPDLITVTGDLIYSSPADTLMQMIVDRLDSYSRPWSIVYGNHDHEHGRTLAELARIITAGKHTINTLNAEGTLADFEIPVYSHRIPAAYLFFMDSHAYATDPTNPGKFSYAWFEPEQVEWVRTTAGKHRDTPSIAFFHIPFPEYADAARLCDLTPSLTTEIHLPSFTGTFGEWVCCPKFNSGMFGAMLQTGFIATFCGHDHDNDFAALYSKASPSNTVMPAPDRASSRPLLLCYGRYSGSNGEYNHLPKGARLITLHSSGSLETCILDTSGTPSNQVQLNQPISL